MPIMVPVTDSAALALVGGIGERVVLVRDDPRAVYAPTRRDLPPHRNSSPVGTRSEYGSAGAGSDRWGELAFGGAVEEAFPDVACDDERWVGGVFVVAECYAAVVQEGDLQAAAVGGAGRALEPGHISEVCL
jgi:hypothetical protein